MREILELMSRLDRTTGRMCNLRLCGHSWGIYHGDDLVIGDGGKRVDDPTADIIAVLKARLPPTREEAMEALSHMQPTTTQRRNDLDTLRRYLEAAKT